MPDFARLYFPFKKLFKNEVPGLSGRQVFTNRNRVNENFIFKQISKRQKKIKPPKGAAVIL
jgi:hypothetical protein